MNLESCQFNRPLNIPFLHILVNSTFEKLFASQSFFMDFTPKVHFLVIIYNHLIFDDNLN